MHIFVYRFSKRGGRRLGRTPRPTTTRVICCFTIQGHQAHSGETPCIIPHSAAECKRKVKGWGQIKQKEL